MIAFLGALISFASKVLYAILVKFLGDVVTDKIADLIVVRILRRKRTPRKVKTFLFDNNCGNDHIDLGSQRFMISSSFGSYFTSLLEREHNFVYLPNQIKAPQTEGTEGLDPIQRVYYNLVLSSGKKIIVIAAEGGMGKSTLAAKIIRCLWSKQEIRRILGDSAKSQVVNIKNGGISTTSPGFYDIRTFFKRVLKEQLREDYDTRMSNNSAIRKILNAVADRKVIFVVDNLETVDPADVDTFINEIEPLATVNSKILITTRKIPALENLDEVYVVKLDRLEDIEVAQEFISWHLKTYAPIINRLSRLDQDINNKKLIKRLLDKTGGIPLIIQLVLSGIAMSDWDYLENLPDNLYSEELLDYLYLQSWNELSYIGDVGKNALALLSFIDEELYKGHKITSERLAIWVRDNKIQTSLSICISMLTDRFLLVNNGSQKEGSFSIVPSLSFFLKNRTIPN